jgi:Bacteriophage head to tail connecting protein
LGLLGEKPEGKEDSPEDQKQDAKDHTATVDMFTHVSWDDGKWSVYQEVRGKKIPSSIGTYPADKSPWIPLRMAKVDGESFGRGYVEEYIGDLKSLEGLSQAIVEGAAAAAKILFLVNPNGTTEMEDLAKTESGGFCEGIATDVTVLQLQKYNDFRVALEASAKIEERLSFAFMLNSSVQRSGERVTAEEIRFMAQELESGLGGVYSILSQEFQLPLINRLMFRMQRAKELPTLPKGIVQPVIVTGIEALGRGNDLNKLDTFMSAVIQIPEAVSRINWADYMTRRATALGLDTEGLIKSDEQVQEEQQQAQMMQMAQQGIGPGIGALGQMAKQGMANGDQANQATPPGP